LYGGVIGVGVESIVATKIVKVNSLAVAERWMEQMKGTYHSSHHKKIGIWEYEEHGNNNSKGYTYISPRKYVVGHSKSIEPKISNLGKRIA